jgi:hypothetical protein
VDDVAEWFARQVDNGGCGKVSAEHRAKILQAVGEHEVDREVLATFTENDILTLFGFSVVGQRRKVMLRIKELCDPNMTARTLAQSVPVFGAQTPRQTGSVPGTTDTSFSSASCLSFSLTPQSNATGERVAVGLAMPAGIPHFLTPARAAVDIPLSAVDIPPVSTRAALDIPLSSAEAAKMAAGCPRLHSAFVTGASCDLAGSGVGSCAPHSILPAIDAEEAARRQAAEAEAIRLRTVSMELTQEVKGKMQAEDFCVNEGLWATKKILKVLQQSSGWAIPQVREAMISELSKLSETMKMPGCSVVTVGDTGAGKSTLLNALLGETSVLPTNGMRAWTVSIIELSYNKNEQGDPYVGEVEFVTNEEWETEFEELLDDLTQQDGKAVLMEPDQRAPSYSSWCKLFAIYG